MNKMIMDQFSLYCCGNGLYRISELSSTSISVLLILKHTKYKHVMIHQFNGHDGNPDRIYFTSKEDAEKALEWVHSIIVMNELTSR